MSGITGYLSPHGYLKELLRELKDVAQIEEIHDRLVFASCPTGPVYWAQNIWLNPIRISFHSISQAAQSLKAIQKNWTLYSFTAHRRASLISEKLSKISNRPRKFPCTIPETPLGSWTLLNDNLMIASSICSSRFPHGEIQFNENKEIPPSRAYLKLWESFTLAGKHPTPGQKCLDLGSSPGGWTWALQDLGAEVISVDKAPLDAKIQALPRIRFIQYDAFNLDPQTVGSVDWLVSDVICYPHRLYELVQKWLKSGLCKNLICTLKFQGDSLTDSDQQAIQAFSTIPSSKICHLFHNKHELTWIKIDQN